MINTYISVQREWNAGWGFNNTLTLTFTLNGSAFDISTYTFALGIRRIGGGANVLSLTQGSGITNGGATGILTIQITKSQTETIDADSYFYTLNYTKNSLLYSALHGTFNLLDDYNPDEINNSISIPVNLGGIDVDVNVTLAGSSQFLGYFVSLAALQTAYPTAEEGNYAYVDAGVGTDVVTYIWDETDQAWVEGGGGGTVESIVAGYNMSVDNTDPENPIVNLAADGNLETVRNLDIKIPVEGGGTYSPRTILGIPVSRIVTDSDSLIAADAHSILVVDIATNKTITINNTVFPAGTPVWVLRRGVGQVTFVQGSGVTVTTAFGSLIDTGEDNLVPIWFDSPSTCNIFNGTPISLSASDINNALGYTAANAADPNLAWTRVVKANAQSGIVSTSYIDLTDLSFPIAANVMMEYRAFIFCTSTNANEGIGFAINGPTLTSTINRTTIPSAANAIAMQASIAYDAEGPFATMLNTGAFVERRGRIQTSASGTIQMRVRADTGAGQSVAVLAGSYLEYRVAGI